MIAIHSPQNDSGYPCGNPPGFPQALWTMKGPLSRAFSEFSTVNRAYYYYYH